MIPGPGLGSALRFATTMGEDAVLLDGATEAVAAKLLPVPLAFEPTDLEALGFGSVLSGAAAGGPVPAAALLVADGAAAAPTPGAALVDASLTDALATRLIGRTGNPIIDGVLMGTAWNARAASYSFPDSTSAYEYPYGAFNEPFSAPAYQAWPQQMAVYQAIFEGKAGGSGTNILSFGSLESVIGFDFVNYGYGTSDIRIAISYYANPTAYSYYPADAGYGGDIWFGYATDFENPIAGGWGYFAHIHEAIHAMGLKGGHEVGPAPAYFPALPYEWDSLEFTVGTYRSFIGAPTDGYRNETFGFPQTLMMLDIQALQYLYGPNWNGNAGNTVYRWNPDTGEMSVNGVGQGQPGANRVFLTIWDGGGTDTYDMSNYANAVFIDLAPGAWSVTSDAQRAQLNAYDGTVFARGTVYNALQFGSDTRSLIENAIGGPGADTIHGNQGPNEIQGRGGDDIIDGGAGIDTAAFQGNFDAYTLVQQASGAYVVSGFAADGTDTLTGIERLRFANGSVTVGDGDPLFDGWAYMKANPDVFAAGADALQHYNGFGWREGRDPNAFFDTTDYLLANPDVRAAGINPLDHYRTNGWREGRDPSRDFDTDAYLRDNPDVRAAGINPLEHYLTFGQFEGRHVSPAPAMGITARAFDPIFYLEANPDVAAAGVDPQQHYALFGWHEGRDPNAMFDTSAYLAAYKDVAAAGVEPLGHYLDWGWTEGRDPSADFDTTAYLAAYPDVAAADINPLVHWLIFGQAEGRQTFGDGILDPV